MWSRRSWVSCRSGARRRPRRRTVGAAGGLSSRPKHIEQRRFAAARRAHDGDELARRDLQRDIVERQRLDLAGLIDLGDLVRVSASAFAPSVGQIDAVDLVEGGVVGGDDAVARLEPAQDLHLLGVAAAEVDAPALGARWAEAITIAQSPPVRSRKAPAGRMSAGASPPSDSLPSTASPVSEPLRRRPHEVEVDGEDAVLHLRVDACDLQRPALAVEIGCARSDQAVRGRDRIRRRRR